MAGVERLRRGSGLHERIPREVFWLCTGALALIGSYLYVFHAAKSPLIDFEVYWAAAMRWRSGMPIYGELFDTKDHLGQSFSSGYLYPPLLAAALSWFGDASHSTVIYGWLLSQFAAASASAVLLWRYFDCASGRDAESACSLFFVALLFVCYEPLYWGMRLGQCDATVLFFFSAALFALRRERFAAAAALLTLAAWIKIYPAVALFAVCLKAPRDAIKGAAAATAVVSLFLLASARGGGTQIYEFLLMFFSSFRQSFSIALRTDFSFAHNVCRIGLDSVIPACKGAIIVTAACAAALVLTALRRLEIAQLYSLSIVLTYFALPTFHFQHLTWLLAPGAYLARREIRGTREELAKRAVPLLLLYFFLDQQNLLVYQVLGSYPELLSVSQLVVAGLLALAAWLIVSAHPQIDSEERAA